MLRLTTKLTVKSKLVLKCEKHPRYNPEKDGRGGIRGNCARCCLLFSLYETQQKMLNAVRDFEYRAQPFETIKPRAPKPPTTNPLPGVPVIPPVKVDMEVARARNHEGYQALRRGDHEEKTVEPNPPSGFGEIADFLARK